ncbi:MAG: tetratricopeptide repeat protein, partial [Bacteroidota bacterium]|nr:tetratricopeptide repeat protein [Bacteroidota bacterium]
GKLAMRYTETDRIIEAVELIKQILEINPKSAEAHLSLGYIYRYAGINDEAIREMEKAIAIDSRNQVFRTILITYFFAGEYEKVIEAGEIFEESAFIIQQQGLALHKLGRNTEAIEYYNRVIKLDPNTGETIFTRSAKAFAEGNPEEASSYATQFEQFQIDDAEGWYFKSFLYGMSGDKEGCIRCLSKAVDSGFYNYPLMSTDSFLDAAREDPEFQKVLQKAKEKHLAFKERFF